MALAYVFMYSQLFLLFLVFVASYLKNLHCISLKVEWSRQQIVDLIDMYETEDCLWNVRSRDYKNSLKKHDALLKIANAFARNKECVEKKLRSLVVAYRREKRKIVSSKTSGSGADAAYHSTWFAYPLLQFLDDIQEPKETTDTLEKEVQYKCLLHYFYLYDLFTDIYP